MHQIDPQADIKLVAVDMDGTFLDGNGQIPEASWALIAQLQERGIAFVPASGRQFETLRTQFDRLGDIPIIAENGTVVMDGDRELYSNVIDPSAVAMMVDTVRKQAALDAGVVLCGRRTAYVERSDESFARAIAPYYRAVQVVEDLHQVDDDIIKMAVNVGTGKVQEMAGALRLPLQVVVSGSHWVDAMNHGVHKGLALERLQEALSISPKQTVVFGDYPNDLEMLGRAHYSFAMANAHPLVAEAANFTAPANTEHGVLQVLSAYLGSSARR
ncbi:hydrolase [Glutamicibacter uratoxydans]|uniref:Hydrolase n=1 Tax=Glutamicibacter uratoxydans TaxID=43667 RepID=A0A4Y4DTN5_GLUUR|nr:HAD family hydrolase [Glutamicibacter uratoxydans]GED07254.1 hydrolase [Glutamicibacter uratoxydans]